MAPPAPKRPPPIDAKGWTDPASVRVFTPGPGQGDIPLPVGPRPVTFDELIRTEAQKAGVPPALALAIAAQESGFRVDAVSPAGAIGIMQLMPATAKQYGVDPTNPVENVQGGVRHLRYLLDKYGPNLDKTLAAYNAGEAAVERADGIPAFKETQAYVPAVLQRFATYAQQTTTPAPAAPPPTASVTAPAAAPPTPASATNEPASANPAVPDKVIDIPGVGRIAFPGSMTPQEMDSAAAKLYHEKNPDQKAPVKSWFQTAVDWRPTVSGVARAVRGFGGDLVVEPAKGMWAMGKRVIAESTPEALAKLTPQERFARGLPGGPLAPLARDLMLGTVEAHGEQAVKAYDAYKEGRWTDVMLHGAGTVIPFLGPAGASIVEEGQRTGDWATAIGRFGALGAPQFLKAGKLVAPTKPGGRVALTYGERTGRGWPLFRERLTERTLTGAPVFERFRLRQQAALQGWADQTVDGLRRGGPRSRADVGTLVARGLEQTKEHTQNTLKTMYGAIDEKVQTRTVRVPHVTQEPSVLVGPQGQPLTVPKRTLVPTTVGPAFASTSPLKQTAIPMLRRIRAEAQLIPPGELQRTTDILTRIIQSPKTLPFQVYQDARSDLLKIVRSHGDLLPGKAAGAAKKFVAETDEAMIQAARTSGIPGLEAEVRAANQFRADAEIFNDTFIKKLVKEVSAENVSHVIRNADVVEIHAVRDLLNATTPSAWHVAQARVMQDVLEEATKGELLSAGQTARQVATQGRLPTAASAEPKLVVRDLERALENMGRERLDAIFGQQATNDLLDVVREGKKISPRSQGIAHGLMMAGINTTILAPFLAPFSGWASWPTSGAMAGSFYGLAQLMTHPEGLTTYRRFAQAVSSGNRPLALTLGTQLTRQIAEEEARRPTAPATGARAPVPAAP